jgi:hypothetical protein
MVESGWQGIPAKENLFFYRGTAVLDDFFGDKFQGQDYESGDDDYIVQMTEDGDEIGDQIEGHEGISYGQAEEEFGQSGRAGILDNPLIDLDFPL